MMGTGFLGIFIDVADLLIDAQSFHLIAINAGMFIRNSEYRALQTCHNKEGFGRFRMYDSSHLGLGRDQ